MLQDVFSTSPFFDSDWTSAATSPSAIISSAPEYHSDYAYAFVMAGCNPERPETYRGVLYSILVNAQLLESYGSKADILVLVQMAHDANTDALPQINLRRLKAYPRIVLRYLPKPLRALSYYEMQFHKFHILKYTRYRRVLYLDYDVIPLCSLDYLFELSERGIFKENMGMAGHNEPVTNAFLMLRPGRGEYQQLMSILEQRDVNILTSSEMKFDEVAGWGHAIEPSDKWRSRYDVKTGRLWNFPAAFADQGLLYHWIKYVKQNVTLFIGNEVENWSSSPNTTGSILEATVTDAIKGYECPNRLEFPYDKLTQAPYDMEGQIWHFWDEKPWMMKNVKAIMRDSTNAFRAYKLWFQTLDKVKRRLAITFDLDKELRESTPTGLWSTPTDMQKTLERKHAYVFFMAGVDPARPRGYRGVLFSILVNAQVLERSGSNADVVILVQMHVKAKGSVLPASDLERLKVYPKIVLHYVPKPIKPLSFYDLHLQKFYMLELTQYRRVIYVDADVMLLCNLDYLFHLSERGILKENMVIAGDNEPALGIFMMLRPGLGEYKRLLDVVDTRDKGILMSSSRKFDKTLGWGHAIQQADRWRARYDRKTGKLWNFPGAYGDQGLVYHWAKYVKKNVSLFIGNEVENWSSSSESGAGPVLEATKMDVLKGYECPNRLQLPIDAFSLPPYDLEGQMWHFWNERPWMLSLEDQITAARSNKPDLRPYRMWLDTLDQVKARLNTRLNMQKTLRKTPLWSSNVLEIDFYNSLDRKYAYAFMIANCDPRNPEGYMGLLFGVLVNAQILDNWGSSAEIVVMVQMAHDSTFDALSDADVAKLKSYGRVMIRYLPKPQFALTFYEMQLQKFRILELFQYRRVLFMDADVIPLCNLDYLFYLSDSGHFKENLIIAGNKEPAIGGFMMLRPGLGEYQQLRSIIETRDATVLESSANFSLDKVLGWGHTIQRPDLWRSRYNRLNGTGWDFSAAFCDQGLMYHWTKYVKKSVSIFIGNEVENWSSSDNTEDPILEATLFDALKGHECSSRMLFQFDMFAKPPFDLEGQFAHFDGKDSKPWTIKNAAAILNPNRTEYLGYHMWFRAFDQVKRKLKLHVDLERDLRPSSTMKRWTAREDFEMILKRKDAVFI